MPAEFGQTREISQRGVYRMVFRCPEEDVARTAWPGAWLLMAAINDQPFDLKPPSRPSKPASTTATWAPAPAASSMRRVSGAFPHSASTTATWCSWAAAQRSGASGPQKATRPAPLPKALPGQRTSANACSRPAACPCRGPRGGQCRRPGKWPKTSVRPSPSNPRMATTRAASRWSSHEAEIKAAFALAEPGLGGHRRALHRRRGTPPAGGGRQGGGRHQRAKPSASPAMAAPALRELVDVLNQDPRRGPEQEYPLDWINLSQTGAVQLELKRQHVTPDSVIPGQQHLAAAQRQHGHRLHRRRAPRRGLLRPAGRQNRRSGHRRHGHDLPGRRAP